MLSMFGKNTWDKIDAEFREMNEYHGSLAEARAEIERLEKEVERLTLFNNECRRSLSCVAEQRDTVWNDAMEAAADQCGHHLSTEDDVVLANDIADRIRALKRSNP